MTLRCSNCGFDNQETAQACLKCSTRLTPHNQVSYADKTEKPNFGGTVQGRQPEGVNEPRAFEDNLESPETLKEIKNDTITVTCSYSDCGFVNLGNRATCIKCHRPFIHDPAEMLPVKEESVSPVIFSGTIDPYRMRKSEMKSCFLGIVPTVWEEQDNRSKLGVGSGNYSILKTDLLANRKFSCNEGERISLNRENIDPSNNTITSQTQAELSFEDGKWYLVDKSEQKTTFILATGKTMLKDGDIILMGDRRIIFKENDEMYQKI